MTMLEALESRQLLAIALPDGFAEEMIATGLDTPTSMTFAPDGRLFVTEKGGTVRVVNTAGQLRSQPFLTLSVDTFRERGLGGIVLDPNFTSNGFVYVYYTRRPASNPNQPNNGATNRLSRFTVSDDNPNLVDPDSERVLLDNIAATTGIHNGGAMQFGADGMLYLGVGEAGVASSAQSLASLNGKILRINPRNLSNIVPADNPFVATSGARGEIWALGLRNPFTMAIQPGTNTLYANDVGQNTWEEVNDIQRGGNYGWPTVEGSSANASFINPIHQYNHDGEGAAITGGVFYDANQFPSEYKGRYFFSDYLKRFIRTLDANDNVATFATDVTAALDLDVAPDGALYYLSGFGGEYTHPDNSIFRIRYTAGANQNPIARARVRPLSGLTPLKVTFNAGRSSDPDGDNLKYVWRFGDGTRRPGRVVEHTYNKKGAYRGRLFVYDGRGGRGTREFRVVAGSTAPRVTIKTPEAGAFYTAGSTIRYAATGTDREDGQIRSRNYSWSFVFHHDQHTHPFISRRTGPSGSFDIPRTGETDPNQFYRATIIVKDSTGLTRTRSVDIRPRTSDMTIRSNVPGVQLTLDGQQIDENTPIPGVVGMRRELSAPASAVISGVEYRFTGWSDGKARTHNINTPRRDRTYTAQYRRATSDLHPAPPNTFAGTTTLSINDLFSSTVNLNEAVLSVVKDLSDG